MTRPGLSGRRAFRRFGPSILNLEAGGCRRRGRCASEAYAAVGWEMALYDDREERAGAEVCGCGFNGSSVADYRGASGGCGGDG